MIFKRKCSWILIAIILSSSVSTQMVNAKYSKSNQFETSNNQLLQGQAPTTKAPYMGVGEAADTADNISENQVNKYGGNEYSGTTYDGQDAGPNMDPNTMQDAGPNMDPNTMQDAGPNMDPNTMQDTGPNMDPNTMQDAGPNMDPNTMQDTGPNMDPSTGQEADPGADVEYVESSISLDDLQEQNPQSLKDSLLPWETVNENGVVFVKKGDLMPILNECLKVSEVSYNKSDNTIKEMEQNGYQFFRFFSNNNKTNQAGVVCVRRQQGGVVTVIIGFRGTEDRYDWQNNININLVSASELGFKGYVHSGFNKRFKEILPAMEQALEDALNTLTQEELKNVHFELTGHSQGAALATIAGVYLYNKLSTMGLNVSGDRFILMLISSPRVFDDLAAAETERLIGANRIFKFSMNGDLVPHFPLKYQSVILGALGLQTTKYKHVGSHFLLRKENFSPIRNHSVSGISKKIGDGEAYFTKVGRSGSDFDVNEGNTYNEKSTLAKVKEDAIYAANNSVKIVTGAAQQSIWAAKNMANKSLGSFKSVMKNAPSRLLR